VIKNGLISRKDINGTNKIVSGFSALIVRICIRINILFLAVASLKNPVMGLKVLKSVKKKRGSIQGFPKLRKYIKAGGRYFFSENIPGWPSTAFNGFIRSEIFRLYDHNNKAPLSTIIFAITSRCKLGCRHCYEWNNISSDDKLTPDNLRGIIRKIKEYGVNHIQLSGGEPLERFIELADLIQFTREDVDLWLLTSGYGLTYEKASMLRIAGLSGADISLDHWDENKHNEWRNNSKSFYWVKEAVKNCREAGITTTLSLCAFRSFVTQHNLMKYADLAKEWGVGFIRILEPREAGRYKGKDISLRKEQTDLLEIFFREINSLNKFIDYPIVTYPGYHQRRIGCLGAGNRYLYIDSVGNIHACPFCQRSAGNAVTDRLEDAVSILRNLGCQKFKTNMVE
jgi:MoaA/NifB/PqqE/SkfB family radical SAM enzyme